MSAKHLIAGVFLSIMAGVAWVAVPPGASATGDGIFYRSCDEVRAAGKAPLYPGQPGFRPELDDNGDGTACPLER